MKKDDEYDGMDALDTFTDWEDGFGTWEVVLIVVVTLFLLIGIGYALL